MEQKTLGGFTLISPQFIDKPAEWHGVNVNFDDFKTAFGTPEGFNGTIAFITDTSVCHEYINGTWYEL